MKNLLSPQCFLILSVCQIACLLSAANADDYSVALKSAFKQHCIKCHGQDGTSEGKVNLLELKTADDFKARPKLLENLVSVLSDREMPPEDEPPLADPLRRQMVAHLKAALKQALKGSSYGATPIRRMNRFQYNNAVVDLLELDRGIFRMNERLLWRRQDYFQPQTRKMPDQIRVSSRPLSKDIDGQRPEGFRGVASFPQDQRAEHGFDNRADHLTMSPLLMESFLQLSQTIVESPDLNPRECRSWDWLFAEPGTSARGPKNGRFEAETGGPMKVVGRPKGRVMAQSMLAWGKDWSGNHQLFWLCPNPEREIKLRFNVTRPATGLKLQFTRAPDYGKFEIYLDDSKVGKVVDLYSTKVERSPVVEIPDVDVKPGNHTLRFRCVGKNEKSVRHFFGLDYLDLTGQPSEAPVVVKSEATEIRSRIKRLLRRAFRREADPETLNRFVQFAERQRAAGIKFEDTMRTVVGAVLGMPDFLYFYESETDVKGKEPQRLNDFELASRLALFFWSSIPDDELLDAAAAGKLRDPSVLGAQIDRMLNDQRSSRFCENFPAQWLQLDRLVTSIPDKKKYPYFYYAGYRTSMHMMSEPLLLFETVFIEDRSIIELIDPKFTWQSEMLKANYAGHAKAPIEVQVQTFKRIPLTDPRRGGVITNAAIMTMTSTPTRTQPITRGAWVNAVIFNDPPDPPPADVPPLPEADKEALEKLTIRERLAVHRKRADCASCHNKIDPLGFALENYGPTGVWRDNYENGRKVDPSGVLFKQHEFKTLVDFKKLLLKEKRRFIRGFVSHLLTYALSRELGPADSPSIDAITDKVMTGDDHLRSVLKQVALSEPFLHKNTRSTK